MTRIRPATDADIPRIADLRSRVFSWRVGDPPEAREAGVRTVFFDSPFRDDAVPSLVYEDEREGVVGFLGVSGRTLRWRDTRLRAAVPTGFMVDPRWRGMAGVRLLRTLLGGPQDVTLVDSPNDLARRMFANQGGVTAPHDSLFWVRPLRPVRYALGQVRNGGVLFAARALVRPVAGAMDALAARWPTSPFRLAEPDSREEPLTATALLSGLDDIATVCSPAPCYDEAALSWLLAALARGPNARNLRQVLVRSAAGDVIGWYLRFANPRGVSDVVQLGARPGRYGDVLDRLFYSAWREGSVAVAGRVQPPFLDTLAAKGCVFTRDGPPVLVHSRHRPVVEAIQAGHAFLSRLEGEWWMIHLSGA